MSEDEGPGTPEDNRVEKMTIDKGSASEAVEAVEDVEQASLFKDMIDCVANSKAVFKSQQKDDPDLSIDEKAKIAGDLFRKNHPMFLSRFGRFLREEHLRYFCDIEKRDYEVMFHVNRLKRYHNQSQRQIDVKNRRYQALKSLVEKGDYFSETEMMRRNPLLYEHLVGQYMTEEQKKARDNIDTQNITFVNLLLESIVRDGTRSLKKEQEEAENDVMEENDSDDDSDESISTSLKDYEYKSENRWGEMSGQSSNPYDKERGERTADFGRQEISSQERKVLRDEFFTNMYHSFLEGRDKDFDYSTVDDEESYDNVDLRTQDEEEKYFDSESPETVEDHKMDQDESSEDELDKYMKSLQEQTATTPNELADEVEKQTIQ